MSRRHETIIAFTSLSSHGRMWGRLGTPKIFLLALMFGACEWPVGPVGPVGPKGLPGQTDTVYIYSADTLYVVDTVYVLHVDGREIVWLYPDRVLATEGAYHYFDISWEEFVARRATTIWVLPTEPESGWWGRYWEEPNARRQNWIPDTPANESHPYYGKLGLYNGAEIDWRYAYFYWDAL